jgi:hypothetical protein
MKVSFHFTFFVDLLSGTIVLNDENAIPLLKMANYLIIDDLKGRVYDFLSKNISRSNVLSVLRRALNHNAGNK